MTGEERRKEIIKLMQVKDEPVSGKQLADYFGVSRQVIVQDIALLRAMKHQILSMSKGYVLEGQREYSRVLKLIHTDEQVEEELSTIVDFGAWVADVFVFHKSYGVVRAEMNIRSRRDIARYMNDIATGKSALLKNVTSGYHYHTVMAEDEQLLDLIQEELTRKGFLAKLQEYEPVNFWEEA